MINKEAFESLSKEQLIHLIEKYQHSMFMIGELCVDESKAIINAEDAVNSIRDNIYYLSEGLDETELKAAIDLDMGKITPQQYRKIILGERND